MQRRDYVTIARALVRAKDVMTSEHMRQAWQLITQSLVREMARDNKAFNLGLFKRSLTVLYDLDENAGFDPARLNVTVRKNVPFKRHKRAATNQQSTPDSDK